ncbi:hypothetical protein CMV_006773 [Castanea mollissima]|uniref:Carboxypeptidase n=1 Tax=Castanea mollissima TaxID=60419 RepID=A0A8J4RV24_9ROSI|nr:hypothetical protein CMV_006773 [Castanea mollissima]
MRVYNHKGHNFSTTFLRREKLQSYYLNSSWIAVPNISANVLFLESPAGVGFSYSNTTSDYDKSGDSRTAADNYVFLVNWLERFPEYKDRDFYISGESYAGHYVPQLAHTILYHNKKANKTIINLKGIIIGNAVINDETDEQGLVDYLGSHAIISNEDVYQIHKYCDFSPNATAQSRECEASYLALEDNIIAINIYNIYAPLCFSSNVTTRPKRASILEFDPCMKIFQIKIFFKPKTQEHNIKYATASSTLAEVCPDKASCRFRINEGGGGAAALGLEVSDDAGEGGADGIGWGGLQLELGLADFAAGEGEDWDGG